METVGFECYNNGTVRPAVMRVKERETERKGSKEEYYGSFLGERTKENTTKKTPRK